ncbi:endonuclease [Peribacillus butanolivorans]|uniref:Endonuclease n=1 Tax=Peribacillus butanolivorans TaxID=421767 RepID=A0AAX0S4S9_9BACI|nr:Z1 domain-containing protein [Peribacillus butanolivorans]PEJ34215.1 endonuclease [Peribacillus butanolivorans]
MKTNETYDALYSTVARKLQKTTEKNSILTQKDIDDSLKEWKIVLDTTPPEFIRTALLMEEDADIERLEEQDWEGLKRTLEQEFVVKVDSGILIQGEQQKNRDKTWWTGKKQLVSDKYYINNYIEYSKNNLPVPVLDVIDEDTDVVMNNLSDPSGTDFSIRGMVVGHVQSGKTANYAALVCKAADAGYRFIVVIAGAQNNLRDQTQSRLEEVFVGLNAKGVGSLPGFDKSKMPIRLTSSEHDFKKQMVSAHSTTNFENNQNPILIVIKKHTTTLDHLLGWLNDAYPNKIDEPMLVIDDESDYASINTKKEEDPTTINRKIRALLRKFKKSAYVAYTATPFANIFIDHKAQHDEYGEDLFPADFIYALKAPNNYFGAEVIFGNNKDEYIIEIPEDEVTLEPETDEQTSELIPSDKYIIKHKKDYDVDFLPSSLYDAVNHFLLNISIRNLKKQRGKHNSMLIHISRFTDMHIQIKFLVKSYVDEVKEEVKAYGKMDSSKWKKYIGRLLETFQANLEGKVDFSFEQILSELVDVIHTVQIIDVHQKMKIKLQYRDDTQTNAIVIGGLSLSRGYTLEGLSISYFMRTTMYYDTLMQMGRWFGYRIGYQELCKIYMTEEMQQKFKYILSATEELIQRLEQMQIEQLTPEDFGLAVLQHPDSLVQVTARNKAKNADELFIEMDLSGTLKETSFISRKPAHIAENESLMKEFVQKIQSKYSYEVPFNGSYVWKNICHGDIDDFVQSYHFYPHDILGLKSRMPVAVIKQYLKDNLGDWDLVLYKGESKNEFVAGNVRVARQKRTVKVGKDTSNSAYYEFKKSQVARSKPEVIINPDEYKTKKASEIRPLMKNPVLFIHAMELIDASTGDPLAHAIALSFSFNGTGIGKKPTKVLINPVMKQELMDLVKGQSYEEDHEDE